MSKVKITVESDDRTVEYEHEAVFFVAFTKEDGDKVECDSGIVGTMSKHVLADTIADALINHGKQMEHPLSKEVAILITLASLTDGIDEEEE